MTLFRRRKISIALIFIFLISLLPLVDLLNPGLPITHDGLIHVARIANFYQSLKEGIIIPRWAGNLNWGYGHPILMFLYPLPSYSTSLFHLIGFSYVNSFKVVFGLFYTLSGLCMYFWLKEILNKNSALLGSTLYLFAPYRFIDMYVRGAFGEHIAFAFIPLTLYFLAKLNKLQAKKSLRNYYFFFFLTTLSYSGLILSHNFYSLIFTPFIIFYIFYNFTQNKSLSKLTVSLLSMAFGLLLSVFFWLPAFIEEKYTLADKVIRGEYAHHFVNLNSLIYSPWNFGSSPQFSVQIGIINLVIIFISIIFVIRTFKRRDNVKLLLIGTFIFLLISIYLMLPQSNLIWKSLLTLQKAQFPWRFLSAVDFSTSIMGAILLFKIKVLNNKLSLTILLLLVILSTASYWHAKAYTKIPDSFFNQIFDGTTDTGELSPIWSIRFMEKRPKAEIEVIDGKAKISKVERRFTYHEYLVTADTKIRIRENTLYFPGWKIYDNYELLNNVEFQDQKNRGIITFYLDPGLHDIILKFEDTKLRRVSNLISLFSAFIFVIPGLFFLKSWIVNRTKKIN